MASEILPLNLGMVNAYLLRAGEGFILIDTGMPMHWRRLEAELLRAGALPGKLKLVVITHGDIDHTGNCAKLQKKYRSRIAVHPGDREQVQSGKPLVRESGTPMGGLLRALGGIAARFQKRGASPALETFTPDVLLADQQSLGEYGLDATVLHTPGHTPGSIILLTGDGRLFAGDTFSNMLGLHATPYIENRRQLRESIDKIKQLDAGTVYPGHGQPFPFSEIRNGK
ncbi:MAG: MBL fold metallo-hydrolase [Anaerolineales bacterium]